LRDDESAKKKKEGDSKEGIIGISLEIRRDGEVRQCIIAIKSRLWTQ
jgi:hypothetical protein